MDKQLIDVLSLKETKKKRKRKKNFEIKRKQEIQSALIFHKIF